MSVLAFVFCFAGLFCIARAMQKHSRHIFNPALDARYMIALRASGWLLLAASLTFSVAHWQIALGTVAWLGIFLVSSFMNTALLTALRGTRVKRGTDVR